MTVQPGLPNVWIENLSMDNPSQYSTWNHDGLVRKIDPIITLTATVKIDILREDSPKLIDDTLEIIVDSYLRRKLKISYKELLREHFPEELV